MRHLPEINRQNPRLAKKILSQQGFLQDADLKALITLNPMIQVLVRCGNGRFVCDVQSVNHFTTIIEEHAELKAASMKGTANPLPFYGDHVRDIGLLNS